MFYEELVRKSDVVVIFGRDYNCYMLSIVLNVVENKIKD